MRVQEVPNNGNYRCSTKVNVLEVRHEGTKVQISW